MGFDPITMTLGGIMAGTALAGSMKKYSEPVPMPTPTIKLPDPTPPPNSPLSPSLTAGSQRARAQAGGAMGNSDIVLTNSSARSAESNSSRTTLLGG